MTALERLARRICWLGFSRPKRFAPELTEVGYWDSISEAVRLGYVEEAAMTIWNIARIERTKSSRALWKKAVREIVK